MADVLKWPWKSRKLVLFHFAFLFITIFHAVQCELKYCKTLGSCKCQTDEGVIDLSPLAAKDKPRFKDIKDSVSKNALYQWNPCTSFSGPSLCKDVAACEILVSKSKATYYNLGTQDTAMCYYESSTDSCSLLYQGNFGPKLSSTYFKVGLVCTSDSGSTVNPMTLGKYKTKILYKTELHSKYACPTSNTGGGLSAGSIMVIVFCCVVLAYIAGGLLVNKYARGHEGRDIFPNVTFWSDLPYLVKDGFVFTFTSCKEKFSKRSGYQAI